MRMDFGPSPSYLYIPYTVGRQASYLAPAPFLYTDSSLSYLAPAYDPSQGHILKPQGQSPSGIGSHLDDLAGDLGLGTRADPLDQFLAGKKAFLARSVEDILGLIYERDHIKHEHLPRVGFTRPILVERFHCCRTNVVSWVRLTCPPW